MSTNPTDQYEVHLGKWTNWSRGAIFGATLTLSRGDANLLIAFVAFFVATVGTRLWRIGCLAFHYVYSSTQPEDGLHHQRQVMLRNTANPESGVLVFLDLAWAWRRNANRTFLRLLLPFLLATVCLIGFTLASGFSSKISSAVGNEVLLSGKNCAIANRTTLFAASGQDLATSYFPYVAKQIENAANYAQQCYSLNGSRLLGCDTFPLVRLPTIVQTNADCPFSSGICKNNDGNLILDTGFLDSQQHFGFNAPAKERFQYRRVFHCAPLVTDGYISQYNLTTDRSYTRYHYGESADSRAVRNFTYQYSNDDMWEFKSLGEATTFALGSRLDYAIGVNGAWYKNGSLLQGLSSLHPIPQLQVADADIFLFFLSANAVRFSSEINDPWYNATTVQGGIQYTSSEYNASGGSFSNTYRKNEPASPLGCTIREQFCNPDLPKDSRCSSLTSANNLDDAIAAIYAPEDQDAALNRINWAMDAAFGTVPYITDIVSSLGSHALQSRYSLGSNGVQGPLPDNQWMLDVQHWHDISLASMQGSFVAAATGPLDPKVAHLINRGPDGTEETALCQNQIILSTVYMSFSLFGVGFIFGLGGLIIVISYTLDPILAYLRRRYGVKQYQQLEWGTNSTLQIQRLAYEEIGAGSWSKANHSVPVTQAGERLAQLDLSDPKHPRLQTLPGSDQGARGREKLGAQETVTEVDNGNTRSANEGDLPPPGIQHRRTGCSETSEETLQMTLVDSHVGKKADSPMSSLLNGRQISLQERHVHEPPLDSGSEAASPVELESAHSSPTLASSPILSDPARQLSRPLTEGGLGRARSE